MFRTAKTLLETRPIYHKCDETIRGHVFCSFLALMLRKELQNRLEAAGHQFKWQQVLADLESLESIEVDHQGKRFLLRTEARGTGGAVFRAVGVALLPTIHKIKEQQNPKQNRPTPRMVSRPDPVLVTPCHHNSSKTLL